MEWQQDEGGGQDECSQDTAPSIETKSTRLAWSHPAGPGPRSASLSIAILVKQGRRLRRSSKSRAPTHDPVMTGRIECLDRILGCFDPHLKQSRDARRLSGSSLPTVLLLIAQEQLKVKSWLKSGAQIVGEEHEQIEDQIRILDRESRKVKEGFASTVGERVGETDERQARLEAVTSQLYKTGLGTEAQSIQRDLLLAEEIICPNEQPKRELENHEISLNLMKQEMLQRQEAQQTLDGEISELKAMVQTLMGQVKGKGKASDATPEASETGGTDPRPPRRAGVAGAPGGEGDPDVHGEGSGRKPDERRKGRGNEGPTPQPEDDYDAENNE